MKLLEIKNKRLQHKQYIKQIEKQIMNIMKNVANIQDHKTGSPSEKALVLI